MQKIFILLGRNNHKSLSLFFPKASVDPPKTSIAPLTSEQEWNALTIRFYKDEGVEKKRLKKN